MLLCSLKIILFIIYFSTYIYFINIIAKESNYNRGIKRITNTLVLNCISIIGLYIVEYNLLVEKTIN